MENQGPKPIRCKAAVCRAAGEPLAIEEIVVDPPKAHEVRIKIICTSLCHSDVTFWRMKDFPAIFPRIFGHEAFGVVESVGENVEELAAGDAVVPTFLEQCSECVDCRSARSNMCSKYGFAVRPGMPRDGQGRPLHHFLVSSFAEYTVVDVNHVVKVNPAMPPALACLLSCGASTGVGAAWKLAKVEPGSSVAIFGLGAVGLAVAEGARICGASKIIGVDINPDKYELAAVCRAAGEPLAIEEIVVDPPKAHEVRIKIICTSLCHSDVTFWRMKDFPSIFPRIFGHEAFGVVESVGEHVEEFAAGDAVVPTFLGQCSECVDCRSARSNMCSKYRFAVRPAMPRDGTTRFSDGQGRPLHHFLGVSSFAEYTVVDVNHVVKVNPAIPPALACLLSCGASTGVGAAWKLAKVEPGSSVAIFGLGAVAEGARICGASKIIGVDINPEKYELGKKFGVTHFINPKELGEKPVHQAIVEMTDGGADYCFECIGLAALMNDAFQSSRDGWGKTIILGVEMHGAPLSISSHEILHGKSVIGSMFGGVKPKQDIPILADKYLNKELELDKFITHEVGFKDINEAFDLLLQGKSVRCTIWMDK